MEIDVNDYENYVEPSFGTTEWLNIQDGYSKVSKLISEDVNIKSAIQNLLSMSIQEALLKSKQS